jgi:hypothetical protein
VVQYDASRADKYDAQQGFHGCAIFGALARQTQGSIKIVNTAAGQPLFTVTAKSADVRAYVNHEVELQETVSRWETAYVGS